MTNQTKRRNNLKWESLVILALIGAFVTGLPAVFAWPAERILFEPGAYKQALEEIGAYDRYQVWLGQLAAQAGERLLPNSSDQLLSLLEQSRFNEVIAAIFPADWAKEQTEGLVDQFWAFFNFETDRFQLIVDMGPVKERLASGQVPEIISIIMQGMPPCTQEDLLEYGLKILTGETAGLPTCRPPEELVAVSNQVVAGLLQKTAYYMADRIDLTIGIRRAAGLGGQRLEAAWQGWFETYRLARLALSWTFWLYLVFLAAVALLGHHTYRGASFWAGLGLALPGFAALLSALFFWLSSAQTMPLIIGTIFGELVVSEILVELLEQVGQRFVLFSAAGALGMLLVGAGLIGGGMLWKYPHPS